MTQQQRQRAPLCTWPGGCGNTTWTGRCYLHRGQDATMATVPGMPDALRPGQPQSAAAYQAASGDPQQIFAAVVRALPDTTPVLDPQSVREQVLLVLRSAVSMDVLRRFPRTDLADHDVRMEALRQYHHELIEACHVVTVTLTDDQAESLSRSAVDVFGRAIEDSAGLAAWALRKEWELGRAMGISRDENDVPYFASYEEFCERVVRGERDARGLDQAVSDEFMRQLCRYPQIIQTVTGRPPKCSRPVVEVTDLGAEPGEDGLDMPAPREPEPARAGAYDDGRGGMLGAAARGTLAMLIDNFTGPEAQRRRADARREREETATDREDSRRQREDDELRRLQLRELRRAQPRWRRLIS